MSERAKIWLRAFGVATPWGDWAATERELDAGGSAIATIGRFDASGFPCPRAATCDHGLWAEDPRRGLTLAALRDAERRDRDGWRREVATARVGIFWGSESGLSRFRCAFEIADAVGREGSYSAAGVLASAARIGEGVSAHHTSPATPAAALVAELAARGPVATYSHACASGAVAIAEGMRAIRQGLCEMAICGGVGADVDPLMMSAFGRLGVLSARGECSPFDRHRDGFALGEGAALLVLSATPGEAKVQLAGAGRTLDAASLTAPLTDGAGAARAITAALRDGGERPERLVHVEAHGTGTALNDRAEAAALRAALGPQVALQVSVSALKGALGHWLAGAGAIGAVAAAVAVERGRGFPIVGLRELDEECGLRGAGAVRGWTPRAGDVALVSSFGFGGANACIALRRAA